MIPFPFKVLHWTAAPVNVSVKNVYKGLKFDVEKTCTITIFELQSAFTLRFHGCYYYMFGRGQERAHHFE